MALAELPGWVSTPDPALYWSSNYVVLDFETTTRFKGSPLDDGNRIILACWSVGGGTVKSTFGTEYDQGELVEACKRSDFIVAHNAKSKHWKSMSEGS